MAQIISAAKARLLELIKPGHTIYAVNNPVSNVNFSIRLFAVVPSMDNLPLPEGKRIVEITTDVSQVLNWGLLKGGLNINSKPSYSNTAARAISYAVEQLSQRLFPEAKNTTLAHAYLS